MIVKIINNKSFPDSLKINSIYKVLKETDKMYKIKDEVDGIFFINKESFEIVEGQYEYKINKK